MLKQQEVYRHMCILFSKHTYLRNILISILLALCVTTKWIIKEQTGRYNHKNVVLKMPSNFKLHTFIQIIH